MKRLVGGIVLAACVVAVVFGAQLLAPSASQASPDGAQTSRQQGTASPSEHAEDALATDLPLIELSTDGQRIGKEAPIVAELSVRDSGGTNYSDDEPTLVSDVALKYRGNSSYLTFDKLSYRVTLLEDGADGTESARREESLLGMASDSAWVLYGPFLDRSLVRNKVMYGIAREIMDWAPDARFCELIVDGEYQGIYLLIEPVRDSAGRLGLTQFGLVSGETAYLVKRDRESTEDNVIETYGILNGYTQQELSIVYPNEEEITDAQRSWIAGDLSRFEQVLYSDAFADPEVGYAAYIDVDEFVDYYLINEFAMISDAGYLSTYIYKDFDEKIKLVVWDFNNGFDNYPWDPKSTDEFVVAGNNWFDRLLQDRAFVDAVCQRWVELRSGILSDEALVERIEGEYASLGDAVERNTEVWGYTYHEDMLPSQAEDGSDRAEPSSPDEAVAMLEDTALARAAWMDEHLADLYAGCVN